MIDEDEAWFTPDDLYKRLYIDGPDNHHLNSSLKQSPGSYLMVREIPLSGDEEVQGEYFLFDHTGHQGDVTLMQYETLDELEASLIGDGGILNFFTTHAIVIVKGKIWRYEIWAVQEGTQEKMFFDKQKQLDTGDFKSWRLPQLSWLK